jgi:hypothetical protein
MYVFYFILILYQIYTLEGSRKTHSKQAKCGVAIICHYEALLGTAVPPNGVGHTVAQLEHCAASRNFAVLIPDSLGGIFH